LLAGAPSHRAGAIWQPFFKTALDPWDKPKDDVMP